jgi:DNA-binding PadR family transcriptional regulator
VATGQYDSKDEYPVLEKLQAAGWITRFWSDRQDIYAEWTPIGRAKMADWKQFSDDLKLESENQRRVMDFFSHYLLDSRSS